MFTFDFSQLGGRKDLLILISIFFFFIILNSLIRNKRVKFWSSIFSTIFICFQTVSLYFTQSFIGYQFYVHFNLRGVVGMEGLFYSQLFVFVPLVLFIWLVIFYFENIIKILSNRIKWISNIWLKYGLLSIFLCIIVLQGNFVKDSGTLASVFISKPEGDFKKVLAKNGITNFTFSHQIKSESGKNIIILSLESFELGFLHEKYSHLTPNLNRLRNEWHLKKMKQISGANWTSGSIYASLTGLPAFFGVEGNTIFQSSYYSHIPSVSNVLAEANYETVFMNGNTDFSGLKEMINVLKFDKIIDYKNLPETGFENSIYGLKDYDLFNSAKKELLRLKQNSNPFGLYVSTTDTHFPDGFYDKRMEEFVAKQNSGLEFMISAVDFMIGDFIQFLKDNDLLESTSIYIFPDHLKMGDPTIFNGTGERGLYVISNTNLDSIVENEICQLDLPEIILAGAEVKHNIKFYSNYIKGDKAKFVDDNILNITEINTSGYLCSNRESFEISNISPSYKENSKDVFRFIAHAGGQIEGFKYTNSKEALDSSYLAGYRLFELDLLLTSDKKIVAVHDWESWSKKTGYSGTIPPTHSEFLKYKINNKFSPLDFDRINKWFDEHKDAILVTDKINSPKIVVNQFIDKSRIMMELFSEDALEEALELDILSAIPSQGMIEYYTANDIKHLSEKGVHHIAVSRAFVMRSLGKMEYYKENNIKPYMFSYKNSPGINEEFILKYETDIIYGIYSDRWSFK